MFAPLKSKSYRAGRFRYIEMYETETRNCWLLEIEV